MGLCYVCVCCEFGCSVLIVGLGICIYCARWIPAHFRCTQCSILLHHIDICFLTCICLWQISQIQTCLRMIVGPELVSTSAAFMRSIVSHPVDPHARLPKNGNRAPIAGGGRGRHNLHRVCQSAVTAPPCVGCVVWSLNVDVGHHMSAIICLPSYTATAIIKRQLSITSNSLQYSIFHNSTI